MEADFDVAVIGAGVMGSATAYRLAREGKSVCLVEQFQLGHTNGSSHGRCRIFRFSYPETRYVEMAMESKDLWHSIEEVSGRSLLVTTGGLDVGNDIGRNADALGSCGARFELIDGVEARRRFPMVSLSADREVLYQPDSGIMLADSALVALVGGARSAGAEVRTQTTVTALEPSDGAVRVMTGDDHIAARAVVVTAGPWVNKLLDPLDLALPVKPTRETTVFFRLDGEPPTLVEWGDPAVYSLPAPGDGIKVGEHIAGPVAHPDDAREFDEASIARLTDWVAQRFPDAEAPAHRAENCFYTNTDDESFILERHDRIVVGSACSGHAFKFAPLVGKRLAALAGEVL